MRSLGFCLVVTGIANAFLATSTLPKFKSRDDSAELIGRKVAEKTASGRRLDPVALTAERSNVSLGKPEEAKRDIISNPRKKTRAQQFIDAVTSGTGKALTGTATAAAVLASLAAFLSTPLGSAAATAACGFIYAQRYAALRGTFVENWLSKCTGIGAVNSAFGSGAAAAATVTINVVESQLDKLFPKMSSEQFQDVLDAAKAYKASSVNATPFTVFEPLPFADVPETWTSSIRTMLGGLPDPKQTLEIVQLAEPLVGQV